MTACQDRPIFPPAICTTWSLEKDICYFSHWQKSEEVSRGLETQQEGDQATRFWAVCTQTTHSKPKCHVLSSHIFFHTLEFAIQLFSDCIRESDCFPAFARLKLAVDDKKENTCLFLSNKMREQ